MTDTTTTYTIRRTTLDDMPTIQHHRLAMFVDMGRQREQLLPMDARFHLWLRDRIMEGTYIGFFALDQAGTVVAGLGLWMHEWPPASIGMADVRGYILNVYTEQAHRGRGLATRLMKEALDECRARRIEVVELHASDVGRLVYEKLGFTATNEMRLIL